MKHMEGGRIHVSLFFSVPFFLWRIHTLSQVLTRHAKILGFTVFPPLLLFVVVLDVSSLFLSWVPLHVRYEGKCQNNGHPEMSDRRRHVRK